MLQRTVSPAGDALPVYWQRTVEAREAFEAPAQRALISALHADRLAFAFASGYQAALCAMFPSLGRHELGALCATEAAGGHPRDLHTKLDDGGRITGAKTFVTGAQLASQLFVVASTGTSSDGRNALRLARVPANASGVKLRPMAELPFVPELPHAEVELTGATAAEVLDGDGYERFLKPFRTVEDTHVHAAALGYLVSLGRRSGWKLERLVCLAVTAVTLAARDPLDAATHVAVGGLIEETRAVVATLDLSTAPAAERERWERDQPLLSIAGRVRARRLERAWESFGGR